MQNKYNLMYIDLSWLLTRNVCILTKNSPIIDLSISGDIMKLALQTIRTYSRDYGITANKIIAVTDLWEPNLGGYYRTEMLKNFTKFKGSRTFMTDEQLNKIKSDPSSTKEDIVAAERQNKIDNLKQYTKSIILKEFKKIGIYTYGKPGYEFDDIVTLASFMRGNQSNITQKDVIVTLDSDLSYSLSPGCDMFIPKHAKCAAKTITYDDMYKTIPTELVQSGITLYSYHAYLDSLGYTGHNDLSKCRKPHTNSTETILKILKDDFSNVDNVELFKAQLNTFNVTLFPKYDEVNQDIINLFETKGIIGSVQEFKNFCMTYNIQGISENYYLGLINNLEQKLYSGL